MLCCVGLYLSEFRRCFLFVFNIRRKDEIYKKPLMNIKIGSQTFTKWYHMYILVEWKILFGWRLNDANERAMCCGCCCYLCEKYLFLDPGVCARHGGGVSPPGKTTISSVKLFYIKIFMQKNKKLFETKVL